MKPRDYETALTAIDDRVTPRALSPGAGPQLMSDAAAALRAAVEVEPRDVELIVTRVLEIAAAALRVIRSMVHDGELAAFPNPTVARLPSLIDDFAPNIGATWIGDRDPMGDYAQELIGAAERFRGSDPSTVSGSADERVSELLRVVGLAARGLAL